MNRDGGWRLPDLNDPERFCVRLYIPKDRAHVAAFLGALEELTKWWNWERDSQKRGVQAAYVWRDILGGLAGLDYSEPTQRTDCDMPQFRMTPECILEYSNDNGATWLAVTDWAQYASCFIGPAGPQGETGPAGPAGPQGEPGVVGAQVVRVDGDTPPDFYYTPETQILTAIMQEQWLRGLRAVREPGYPTIQFQVQTYDGQPEWITLMEVPDIPPTQFVFPQQPETLTPEEAKCLAAMNAAEVLRRTYNDVGTSLSGHVIDDPLDAIRIIAESIGGLIAGEYPLSTLGELAVILAFIGNQLAFANGWPEEQTERLRDTLLAHASVDAENRVMFDYDALRQTFGDMYDAEGTPWGNINYLLFFLGPNAINVAGAVAYYTEPNCTSAVSWGPEGFDDLQFPTGGLPSGVTVYRGNNNLGTGNPAPSIAQTADPGNTIMELGVEFNSPGETAGMAFDVMHTGTNVTVDYTVTFYAGGVSIGSETGSLTVMPNGYEFYSQTIAYTPRTVDAVRLTLTAVGVRSSLYFDNWKIE